MNFNNQKPNIIHLDINSCFATIEQQSNPHLRGKPIAVVAYNSPGGCILASSIEAKRLGIKTGLRLSEGRKIYPNLISLLPDPPKYRDVHKKIKKILDDYSPNVTPKSIDEFVFASMAKDQCLMAKEIKNRIKEEVGEHITVSVGISTNRYLAKVASNLQKPDGLYEITVGNFEQIFKKLSLTDLTGIKRANAARLRAVGILSVLQFYHSPIWKLKIAFGGVVGLYWYLHLHGYEIDPPVGGQVKQKTFGNSYAPPKHLADNKKQILSKLCEKTGFRLRLAGFSANGVHLSLLFRDGRFWHRGRKTKAVLIESKSIYREAERLLGLCPIPGPSRIIAVSVFGLEKKGNLQLQFFKDLEKNESLVDSIDKINQKWGNFVIHPARMAGMDDVITDRIAFASPQ